MTLAVLVLSSLVACGGDDDSSGSLGPTRAVIAAGPFISEVGTLATIDMASIEAQQNVAPATAVGGDPMVRVIGDELFVVNRYTGNNVTILSARDYSLVEQIGTGAGSNPQDVAVIGDKLYVANYQGKGVTVLTRGSTVTTEIDLGGEDPDGTPNCSSIYAVGTKLYVACQIADDTNMFSIRGTSKVYVVDTANNNLLSATIALTTPNPFGHFEEVPDGAPNAGSLLIGTVNFNDGSGCIERITTDAAPDASCLVDNTALGGNALRIAFGEDDMYIMVSAADFSGGVVRTAPVGTADLHADAFTPPGQPIGDVAVCPDSRVIVTELPPFGADPSAPYGVRIYEESGAELTTAPIDIGMKPGSQHGAYCY